MNPGSPAAARSGRRTPPPATSSSGSGRCGRSPSRPRCCSSKCHLPILTYSSLPRRRDAARASRRSDARSRPIQKIRGRPHALLLPRGTRQPAARPLLIAPRLRGSTRRGPGPAPLGESDGRRCLRPRGATVGSRRPDWNDRIQPASSSSASRHLLRARAGAVRCGVVLGERRRCEEGRRRSTCTDAGGGLRFWKKRSRRRKWILGLAATRVLVVLVPLGPLGGGADSGLGARRVHCFFLRFRRLFLWFRRQNPLRPVEFDIGRRMDDAGMQPYGAKDGSVESYPENHPDLSMILGGASHRRGDQGRVLGWPESIESVRKRYASGATGSESPRPSGEENGTTRAV